MAGAAAEEEEEAKRLAKKITEAEPLPLFNDGYSVSDYRSAHRAGNDPVYIKNYNSDIKGRALYNLFKAEEYQEFYTMYFDDTTPLDKFYFFYEILQAKNNLIHRPEYKCIKDEIRRQLLEHPHGIESDLSQMLSNELSKMVSDGRYNQGQYTPLDNALFFINEITPPPGGMGMVGQLLFRPKPRPSSKGGKRHSRIKRKIKSMSKSKSRRKSNKHKAQKKKSHRRRHI